MIAFAEKSSRFLDRLLLVGVLLLGLVSTARAAELYVAKNGNDSAGNGSQASPFLTIGKAILVANPNDIVLLQSGIFQTTEITLDKPLSISGNGSHATTIDGGGNSKILTVNFSGDGMVKIRNLTIANGHAGSKSGYITQVLNGRAEFENLILENSGKNTGGVLFRGNGVNSTTFRNCVVRNNRAENYAGIGSATVIGCLLYGNQGTNNTAVLQACHSINTLAYGNSGGVLGNSWTVGAVSGGSAVNCIFWNNAGFNGQQIYSPQGAIENCIVQGGYTGPGNLSTDPKWENPATNDFRLKAASPAINAGKEDLDGDGMDFRFDEDDRDPDGSRKDIGPHPTNSSLGTLLSSHTISWTKTADSFSTASLVSGKRYYFKISGTFSVHKPGGFHHVAFNVNKSPHSGITWNSGQASSRRPIPDLWDSSSTYFYYFVGSGSPETFEYSDSNTGDNGGALSFELH
ncbi:DUF1565 domain-containing protein, partial [Opitutales bacterium]|nr:DUF1565 domain-containing protein [Opitutales bacterium]